MSPATSLSVAGLSKAFGATPVLVGLDLEVPSRQPDRRARPLGLRQDDAAAADRRLRATPTPARSASASSVLADPSAPTSPPSGAAIGFVPQEGALFPHLDVAANVAFGLPRAAAPRRPGRGAARARRPRRPRRAPAAPALRRPAAARRAGARAGARTRRWSCSTSPSTPSTPACATRPAPGRRDALARGRRDRAPRHPRPGGGALAGRHGRRHARRPDRPGRRPPDALPRPGRRRGRGLRRRGGPARRAGSGPAASRPPSAGCRRGAPPSPREKGRP